MGILDDEFLSSNLGNFIDYTFEIEGEKYTGSYHFSDENEILSPVVEVTYLTDDPTVNEAFVEEKLQKMIENSKSTSTLWFGIGVALFGAFWVFVGSMQVVAWIRALKG